MDITQISKSYKVRILLEEDIEDIFKLCVKNTLYYYHCPPMITKDLVREDMYGLPKGKTLEDKYYVGFFDHHKLIAIMDLIDGYPHNQCAYIGFFMLDVDYQNKGIGTAIIYETIDFLKNKHFNEIQLGFVKTNPQAKGFWLHLGFKQCRDDVDFGEYLVVPVSLKI